MDEFKNAYFFRGFAGLASIAGLVMLIKYWSFLYPLSSIDLLGACYAIAIASTIISSFVYCLIGRLWYVSFTSILFLLILYFAGGAFSSSPDTQFCQRFAQTCLKGGGEPAMCSNQRDTKRYEKVCGRPF